MAEENKHETKTEEKKEKIAEASEKKAEEKKKEIKKSKTEAVVNSFNSHMSTKTSAAICRFIIGKTPEQAIEDLREVIAQKKAVSMRGEIPHRKGKIMAGRFPKNASEYFIKMLKTLAANSNVNNLDNPVIVEAIANIGNRPYGRFGRIRRKRTHVKIIAKQNPNGSASPKNNKMTKEKKEIKWKKKMS